MSILQETCVLVKFTHGKWDGFRRDKSVSKIVDQAMNAKNSGNFNKRLLTSHALSPLKQAVTSAYKYHCSVSLPWCYDGVALLPNKIIMPYSQRMRMAQDYLDVCKTDFKNQYPVYVSDRIQDLGKLGHKEEFLTADQIISKFYLDFQFFPVPVSTQFSLNLDGVMEKAIEKRLDKTLHSTENAAIATLLERMKEYVEHMQEILNSDVPRIFESSLEKIRAFVEVAPSLNIFSDPEVAACIDIFSNCVLRDHHIEAIRNSPEVRKEMKDGLDKIQEILSTKLK